MIRTLEQRIKFDSGLTIGKTPVTIRSRDGTEYRALVEITGRGGVYILQMPGPGDMYTGWYRVKDDTVRPQGAVIVWGSRNPELLKQFDNPVTTISFQ